MADKTTGLVVTREIKHHVDMGPYEYIEFGATISAPLDNYPGKTPEEVMDLLAAQLDEALATDVDNASAITPNDNSYIHAYAQR